VSPRLRYSLVAAVGCLALDVPLSLALGTAAAAVAVQAPFSAAGAFLFVWITLKGWT